MTTLLALRALALYLLVVLAAGHALAAWSPPGQAPAGVVLCAFLLAAAQAGGELLAPRLSSADRGWRSRVRLAVETSYAGVILLVLILTLAFPQARVLAVEVRLLLGLQCAFLLLEGLRGDPLLAIVNGLILAFVTSIHGGVPATGAVLGFLGTLVPFLVFDHFVRVLSVYPRAAEAPLTATALRQALLATLPVLAVAALLLAWRPPLAYADVVWDDLDSDMKDVSLAIYRLLAIAGFMGGAAVYVVSRFLRSRRKRDAPIQDMVDPVLAAEEPLPPALARRRPEYEGANGRVVKLYLDVLEHAADQGWRRRPPVTSREFARQVRPQSPALDALTGLFMQARYGRENLQPADVEQAEQAARKALTDLSSRGGRGRPG